MLSDFFSVACRLYTRPVQSRAPENGSHGRPHSDLWAQRPVLSPSRITPGHNGKIRPQPDRENSFAGMSGGETGIRTLGGLAPTTVFETAPFDHSGTSPQAKASVDDAAVFSGGAGRAQGVEGPSRSERRANG